METYWTKSNFPSKCDFNKQKNKQKKTWAKKNNETVIYFV